MEKDVRIRAQSDPTENVAGGGEGENPGGKDRATEERDGEARERRYRWRARWRQGAREEAASGESAKGAAFN